jgi:hypothetical protein
MSTVERKKEQASPFSRRGWPELLPDKVPR